MSKTMPEPIFKLKELICETGRKIWQRGYCAGNEGNHGSVSFSDKSLTDAYYKLEILDAYCRLLILTRQLGTANVLNPQQMTELLQVKEKFGFPDERLTCSPTGCVGEVNQPFFASFDGNTPSASTQRDGQGPVSHAPNTTNQTDGDPAFEAMVATITDQIMAAS